MKKRGFTLIELLIVIVIIGILATIVVGIVGSSARKKANDAKKKSTVHEIQNALEQYFVDNDKYPASIDALKGTTPPLLGEAVVTTPYTYAATDSNTKYTLSFVLENTNDNSEGVTTSGSDKIFQVTNKQ